MTIYGPTIDIFIFFALGSIIGSLISAANHRLHTLDKGFWHERSHCIWCKKELNIQHLIPIISYLIQSGKCAYCKKKIHYSYFLNELLLGLIFAFTYYFTSFNSILLTILTYSTISFGYAISSYDARHQQIPDLYSFTFIFLSIATGYLLPDVTTVQQAIGILIGGGFFFLQYIISFGRWIGSGDILLGIGMGAILGWQSTIVAIMIAYITGSIIGIMLITKGKLKKQTAIAFGPFLMLGAFIAFFYGIDIYNWYTNLTLSGL